MKKKIVVVLFLLVMMYAPTVYADTIKKDFSFTTGVSHINEVERAKDEGIVAVGNTGGDAGHFITEKYDKDRNLLWAVDLPQYKEGVSLVIDEDDNIYILARRQGEYIDPTTGHSVHGGIYQESYIVKIDKNGNVLSEKRVTNGNNEMDPRTIRYHDNKLYALVIDSAYSDFAFSIKSSGVSFTVRYVNSIVISDKNANQLAIVELDSREEYTMEESQSNIGGYIWGGAKECNIVFKDDGIYSTTNRNYGVEYSKISYDNNLIWHKEYEYVSPDVIYNGYAGRDMAITPDNKIIVTGASYKDPSLTNSYIKINNDGEIIDEYKVNDEVWNNSINNIRNQDNGYYVAIDLQQDNIENINNETIGMYLVRYDYDFNVKASVHIEDDLRYMTNDINNGVFAYDKNKIVRYYLDVPQTDPVPDNNIINPSTANNLILLTIMVISLLGITILYKKNKLRRAK